MILTIRVLGSLTAGTPTGKRSYKELVWCWVGNGRALWRNKSIHPVAWWSGSKKSVFEVLAWFYRIPTQCCNKKLGVGLSQEMWWWGSFICVADFVIDSGAAKPRQVNFHRHGAGPMVGRMGATSFPREYGYNLLTKQGTLWKNYISTMNLEVQATLTGFSRRGTRLLVCEAAVC